MKKSFIVLLSSLVILTSCDFYVDKTKSPVDPNVFCLSSLPDIGDFSGNDKRDKFSDNVTDDFVPSDEYGKIVPFIGSYRVFETPNRKESDWHTEQGYASYGFMTTDGKTVMEPSDKNSYISYQETDDGFGYYVVNREARQRPDAPDEYIWGEILVIPIDGSWCISFGESSWVSGAGGGYISVCEYPNNGVGEVSTHIYDYNGNLVKSFKGIDNVGTFSKGLMLISEWKSNEYSAGFINEKGEVVFGPYKSASGFNKYGITTVEDENGAYIMNADGEMLTDYYRSFFREYSADMSKQVFAGRRLDDNKTSDVYNENGEYLGTVSGSTYFSFRFPDNGEIYAYHTIVNDDKYQTLSDKMMWKRLSDGTEFVSKEFGISANSYMGHDNCYIYLDSENGYGLFFDGDGNTIAEIDDICDVISVTQDNSFIVYFSGKYDYKYNEDTGVTDITDTRILHIYDVKQQKNVYSNEKIKNAYMPYYSNKKNDRFVIMPIYLGNENDMFGGLSEYSVYDLEQNKLVFENLKQAQFFLIGKEVFINTCTANTCTVYDDNFNVIRKSYYE